MSEDMSKLFEKVNQMLKNNEIPDEIKNILSSSTSENNDNQNYDTNNNNNFQFDMNTMLKMKSIMDAFNNNQNNPRNNLLKSLKPYLKPSRKEKVDQYIQLMNVGKVIEMMNSVEGDKKNDV